MRAYPKLQYTLSILLFIGIMLSAGLVILGGTLFLIQHGNDLMQMEILRSANFQSTMKHSWYKALSFTPLGIIELGLFMLIATQFLRVALLACFYAFTRDYAFVAFSSFILCMLIYSLFLPSLT